MLWLLREKPSTPVGAERAAEQMRPHSFAHNIINVVNNRALWWLALALGFLNATRHGSLDWGLSHIKEVQATGVGAAALKYAVLPLGGIAGALVSGWVSDRWFGGRRIPVVCALLVLLAAVTLVYSRIVHLGTLPVVITLALVGFLVFGAQVLLVGTLPIDLARPGTDAASVGVIDCMGYAGASVSDVVIGSVVVGHGWETAVICWSAYALLAALAAALLWNVRARREA